MPAAIGFAQDRTSFELGIIRNHYVGRTFIEPEQRIRALGVKLKHSANASVIRGKRIVLVDDSVVRGTTSKKIVELMYEAGAREVHMRIASPPITHPDYYGIDTPDKVDLLAANKDLEGMRAFLGADSLAFLSVNGIYRAVGSITATRAPRSSPTTASRANIRPRSPTRAAIRCRGSSRCWPRLAEKLRLGTRPL